MAAKQLFLAGQSYDLSNAEQLSVVKERHPRFFEIAGKEATIYRT
jgi:hypothetical protein